MTPTTLSSEPGAVTARPRAKTAADNAAPVTVGVGGVGDGIADDTAAVNAAIVAAPAGGAIDGGGRTFRVTAPIVVGKTITLRNGKLVAGDHQALVITAPDVAAYRFHCERGIGAAASDASDQRSNVVVNAPRFLAFDCNYTNANLACLYFVHAAADDSKIFGGRITNTSAVQDSAGIYAAAGGGATVNKGIVADGVDVDGTCAQGILLFDPRACRVNGCKVRNMAKLPDVELVGWANVAGNVYRATDRTDGATRVLFDNGAQQTENTATPATPGAGEWGIAGGFVYLNLGGTDPATRTITSRIVSGYGITLYVTGAAATPAHDNVVSNNEIHDVDGFGIYFAFGPASVAANNKTTANRLRNVCTSGVQTVSLPFAGIGVDGGVNTLLLGDTVVASGADGVRQSNGGTGRALGVTVDGSTNNGFYTGAPWRHLACKSVSNTQHGFLAYLPGGSLIGLGYTDCEAAFNANFGLHAENTTGAAMTVEVIGGEYHHNTQRGIQLSKCSDSKIVGPSSHDNGAGFEHIYVNNAASARVIVDDCTVYNATWGITVDAGTDIAVGLNHVAAGVTNPLNLSGVVRVAGTRPAAFMGSGTPEGAVTAPVGSTYARTNGGAGTSLYVKESGAGNTGWVGK